MYVAESEVIAENYLSEVELFSKKLKNYRNHFNHFFEEVTAQSGSKISISGVDMLNFCTYSYLCLFDHPEVKKGAQKALLQYGCGTHGVRLLGGNLTLYRQLEKEIASFCNRDDAILFTSGFLTNQTVIRALVRPGDVIFNEKRNHASIVDGCKLANAEVINFCHKDIKSLEQIIAKQPADRRKLIVADAVFSMDGDILDLPSYLEIRDRYPNTLLMIDEAHSLAVLGENGRGIEEHFGIDRSKGADILMGTLSKAIPGNGGFISSNQQLIDYLRYHVRGYIFTAALAPPTAGAAIASLGVIKSEGRSKLKKLWRNVNHLRKRLAEYQIETTQSQSPITGVLIGNERKAFAISNYCFKQGLFVLPVAYPAVPRRSERIRFNVHCNHSLEEIDKAVEILSRAIDLIMGENDSRDHDILEEIIN